MKNTSGCSSKWTGTDMRYLAKKWGLPPSLDPHMIFRSTATSLSFEDPGPQIPQTFEVRSVSSRGPFGSSICACTCTFTPTSACNGLFPEIHSHRALKTWLTSLKVEEGCYKKIWASAIWLASLSSSPPISSLIPSCWSFLGAPHPFPFVRAVECFPAPSPQRRSLN